VKLLTVLGFRVRSAENGEEAIRTWEEWKPQLILMDVHMPVMDGLEATRRIKSAPGGSETAIIALTASAMDDERRSALQSGVDDFLGKPFNQNELLGKMRGYLNIVYDYEESSGVGNSPAAGMSALTPERLRELPSDLLGALRVAIVKGKKRMIDGVIVKIDAAGYPGPAAALQLLADSYDYVALTQFLDSACCG
jgi:CheY-like chemotaxis protein